MRTTTEKCLFALDTPPTGAGVCQVGSPFILSGWLIPRRENRLRSLKVMLNGELRAVATHSLKRQDVAEVFPEEDATWCGFAAEVFADDLLDQTVSVQLVASFDDGDEPLHQFEAHLSHLAGLKEPRLRSWSYAGLLACPSCGGEVLVEDAAAFRCSLCARQFEKRRGVPLFHKEGEVVTSRLLEQGATNPLAAEYFEIIESFSDGVILNLGAGNPRESEHYPHMLFHEVVHYSRTDVVSTYERLPYRDNVFDAVISLAVFEHLPRPWEMVEEIHRVLKPNGIVYVDTAFMQPLHADPSHWFNMTLEGVREIFKRFNHLDSGVQSYQKASFSLRMQIETILDHLRSDKWRRRFEELRDLLDEDFDSELDERGQQALAAGVFFKGRKG